MSIKEFYAKIEKQFDQKLPFVVYHKANTDQLEACLQNDDMLYEAEDYATTSGFVFAPFDSVKKAITIPLDKSQYSRINIYDKIEEYKQEVSKFRKESFERTKEKQRHLGLVEKGISAINSGMLRKVVLSRREVVETVDTTNPLGLFKKLVVNYPTAFTYLWYHPKVGIWLGATPETLVYSNGIEFNTMALAGTQPYQSKMEVDWPNKELEEQEMVTEFIVKELSPISNDIVSSKTYTHRAGTLLHLRTDIKGNINSSVSGIEGVVKILHPTPAICGLPKDNAKAFILDNEGYDRKFYTGYLGEVNMGIENKESVLFVNLRCMELESNKAILYVGGGITKDSNPDREWEETVRKTETMKKVLF